MGITSHSIQLLEAIVAWEPIKNVCELGAQNLYIEGPMYGKYANEWYKNKGIEYQCIDLNGENDSFVLDLSMVLPKHEPFDLVTDFGTSEHVKDSFYNCWLNKWNLCRVGGTIISENPMTGNWPGHGYNYVTLEFYKGLSAMIGCPIELGEHPAMGNATDGWNVWCIMKKNREDFITEEQFNSLDWRKS